MQLAEYQRRAQATDQQRNANEHTAIIVPLLGLAGEAGTLLSAYKKWLRDGEAHRLFKTQVIEDLGDILWYLANLAEKFEVSLDDVALANLTKVEERFGVTADKPHKLFFDAAFPVEEQLPHLFAVTFIEERVDGKSVLQVTRGGKQIGDILTDNAFEADGYRFHDAFHFAYATMLGWSPTTRYMLKCKRRSDPTIDNVEDGGRALVFEEGIAALVFERARQHNFYENVDTVDYDILKTIKNLVWAQEVKIRTPREWEHAILEGFRIWRLLNKHSGGTVIYDLENRTMKYHEPEKALAEGNHTQCILTSQSTPASSLS